MAYLFGTAANPASLMSQLLTFLTTNATLVAGDQEWEIIRSVGDDHLLRGRGADGSDNIFIRLRLIQDNPRFGILINGFDSYNSALPNGGQANMSGEAGDYSSATWVNACTLWNSSMNFWFFASGRRFIVVVQVNTYYHSLYGGLILPYATEDEFPYPLYVGCSCSSKGEMVSTSNSTNYVRSFWNPTSTSIGGSFLRHIDGSWINQTDLVFPYFLADYDFPGTSEVPLTGGGSDPVVGGLPVVLSSAVGGGYVYGELDGVVAVKGQTLVSQDIVTLNGENYIVFQSAWQTAYNSYCAIRIA